MLGDWTAIWRHEGQTTTLQGVSLEPYTVVDANVQREVVPACAASCRSRTSATRTYQVNLAGSGTAASPLIVSRGLPRTVRVGVEAYRF